MRVEVRVDNESDALVFADAALRGSGIGPGDSGWDAAIAARRVLAVWLESEDPARVRIVVDEPLDGEEHSQWLGVVRAALQLADGRLAVCGGVAWILDGGRWTQPLARVVELPAGLYRATLYCHAPAPNGRWCAEQAGAHEALGAWFRRTRAGEPMPVWLHNRCVDDPSLDPGRAASWRRAEELAGGEAIDFVLHLESLPAGAAVADAHAPEDGLWQPRECRRPELFPLGIAPAGARIARVPVAAPKADARVARWQARALMQRVAAPPPQAIAGGPVGLPLAHLGRLARLVWWSHPYAHPGLHLHFPKTPPRLRAIEDVEIDAGEREWWLSFRHHEQPADAQQALAALAAQLDKLPDGTAIVFCSARPGAGGPLGAHHYEGVVRGGEWQIEAAFPALDAGTLAEALALAQAAEGGRRLLARDADEAQRIEERVRRALADCFGSNALLRDGAELVLRRRDDALFAHLLARVFWMRYPAVWPLQDEDLRA